MLGNLVTVRGLRELLVRGAPLRDYTLAVLKLQAKPRVLKVLTSVVPEDEMLATLLEMSDYTACSCGFANRKSNG